MDVLDLNGPWRLRRAGARQTIAATVPGCVHADLLAAGQIADPFYRDNESKLRWIGRAAWVYRRQFDVPGEWLVSRRVLLRCTGLDTLASITINRVPVGRTDNAFRTWEFDVTSVLRPGRNRIEVRFDSVIPYIDRRDAERPLNGFYYGDHVRARGYVRKSPCNFGWDWGPELITCGIWRGISLEAVETARMTDVRVLQHHGRRAVRLDVAAAVQSFSRARLQVKFLLTFGGRAVASIEAPVRRGKAVGSIRVRSPRLWWPNGLGGQPLYDLHVELACADGRVLNTQTRRVGLRTLRLVRKKDRWGESFQFNVNGRPFFAKGANWIPADALVTRVTPRRYEQLVADAAAANMNMLRVWGGGIYEHDAFYDSCDRHGICVWQDFMFSCGTQPTFDEAWMANVEAEARDAIGRLRHHPCIALWCGNNEIEQSWVAPETSRWHMSWKEYGRLFDRLLPRIVAREDPQRDYWPCSPHTPRGQRANFNDPTCGDAHIWDVWHGRKPFEWYRTCEHRFNSEFGFQSLPVPATVEAFTADGDRNLTSRIMEYHQRCAVGNDAIMQYMLDWFRMPVGFDNTVWTSQILQATAIKYAVEHWRRSRPRGMGTLYWQLNDTWPGPSWSSIDFFGRWKALHYLARRFYAPLLISGLEDAAKGTVEVHVTSDLRTGVTGRICWELTTVHGKTVAAGHRSATIAGNRTNRVMTISAARQLQQFGAHGLMLWLRLEAGRHGVAENFVAFCRPKHMDLADPRIAARVARGPDKAFNVTLTSRKPALWAWLELADCEMSLSDNFVHVRPGHPMQLLAAPRREMTCRAFRSALRVRSLFDTYAEA